MTAHFRARSRSQRPRVEAVLLSEQVREALERVAGPCTRGTILLKLE